MAKLSSDFGRTARMIVSGYGARIHQSALVRGEKRVFVMCLNGAIPKGRTITSARWQIEVCGVLTIANPRLSDDKRETAVDMVAAQWGSSAVKCTATLDNGEVFARVAIVTVLDAGAFDAGQTAGGSGDLTVSA